jgi:hypothetical protein
VLVADPFDYRIEEWDPEGVLVRAIEVTDAPHLPHSFVPANTPETPRRNRINSVHGDSEGRLVVMGTFFEPPSGNGTFIDLIDPESGMVERSSRVDDIYYDIGVGRAWRRIQDEPGYIRLLTYEIRWEDLH